MLVGVVSFQYRQPLEWHLKRLQKPNYPSHARVSGRWRHRIAPQKYVLFVVAHFNGVANGKMFGMRFVTALSAVGVGVELLE